MNPKKLNLIQMTLKRARRLHDLGVSEEAGRFFHRLMGLHELPAEVAVDMAVVASKRAFGDSVHTLLLVQNVRT